VAWAVCSAAEVSDPNPPTGGDAVFERRAGRALKRADGKIESALLDVRVLPWRVRPRIMGTATFRRQVRRVDPTSGSDDVVGAIMGLVLWLAVLAAAPLLVLVLAGLLLSVELPILVIVALLLVGIRFAGLIPWTVVVIDRLTGVERTVRTRNFLRAVRRIQTVNGQRRVSVRWRW
jgi:hypothetical protein